VRTDRLATPVGTLAVALGGIGLLAWRLRLLALEDPARSLVLGLVLGAVLAASLLVPAAERRARFGTVLAVTAVGLTVFTLAAAITGPRPSVPWAATALGLSLLAGVAEEALFRRALYGALLRRGPAIAVVVSAVAFALLHVPAYGWVAFPVDLGAGLVFGWQRHASGTWAAPALTHVAANLSAVLR
jgi:membrane protease YdiL (CAAX protease family)